VHLYNITIGTMGAFI